ncbi:MAG: PepSY domain-containing protein, partial [Hyphococcus sp.]
MEISWSDVPDTVAAALRKAAPGFKADYIELSVRDGGAAFVYEFEGVYDGGPVDIEIDESGDVLVFSGDALS